MEEASTEKIRILVRVRPLSNQEISKGHRNIIEQTSANSLTIWDPLSFDVKAQGQRGPKDANCWARNFSYDHVLWSDNESSTSDAQERVHETIGTSIVDWAVDGYNTCVLAYGQTGAGKSYTMLGADEEFGLIPRLCFSLFEYFETISQERGVKCSMEFSYLQIYNENLRDCLAPGSSTSLKVREHPKEGSYVANLTTIQVTKFEDILSLMAIGNKARAVASTRANIQSSRSHGIIILTVRQRFRNDDVIGSAVQQKISRIHLTDLAGSERSSSSGAVGVRLKEANNINKSLSVLGDVIKCLGESSKKASASSSHKRTGHIPYRNSVLTMVLRHSLGGNSHTTMVAAVSPSSADYDETISTLKYVDNVKKVRNRVAANVSSLNLASEGAMMLVPVLQAEVQKLRDMLQSQQAQQTLSSNISLNDEDTFEIMEEMHARVSELELQLKDRESLIKSLELENHSPLPFSALSTSVSVDRSLDSSSIRSQPFIVLADDAVDTTLPRVINLNQDPLFSECLVYYIPDGVAIAGCDEMDVDILLSGPDILSKHCLLHNDHDRVWIEPACSKSKVYVNGKLLMRAQPGETHAYLSHFDRISIGRYHLFRFEAKGKSRSISPQKKSKSGSDAIPSDFLGFPAPGWDFAHDELMLNKDTIFSLDYCQQSDSSGLLEQGTETPRGLLSGSDRNRGTATTSNLTLAPIRKSSNIGSSSTSSSSSSSSSSSRYSNRRGSFDGSNFDEDEIVGLFESVNAAIEYPQQVESSAELRERVKRIVENAENKIKLNLPKKVVKFSGSESSSTDELTSRNTLANMKQDVVSLARVPAAIISSVPSSSSSNTSSSNSRQDESSRKSTAACVVKDDLPPPPPPSYVIFQQEAEKRSSNQNHGHGAGQQQSETENGAFEDEATSLQRDMMQMQEKLALRMKRYTSSSKD